MYRTLTLVLFSGPVHDTRTRRHVPGDERLLERPSQVPQHPFRDRLLTEPEQQCAYTSIPV